MKTARLIRQSLRMMTRARLRSGFMMLGSLVGVAALTFVISIGEAANRKMLTTVDQIIGNSSVLVFARGGRQMSGPRGEAARLTLDDIEAVARELPGIAAWDAQQGTGEAVRHADRSATARILGQTERYERVWNRGVSRGTTFDAAAVAGSARVALVGETVARELFGEEDPLDAEILIGPVRFRIIGILERFGTDAHGMDRDNEVVVPLSTAMRRLLNVDTIQGAKLLVSDPAAVEETAGEVARILRERHALLPGQPNDFQVRTSLQAQAMVAKVQRVLFLFLPLVAGISLLAGGVVAASLMLASVNERTGEIGLRRAVGARPQDIQLQFLFETAVTALGGGLAGLALGTAAAELAARKLALGEVFSWQAILLGITAAAVTGFLAGVVPARRAARLQPVASLRSAL
jgi:putative ABC transport system permease protein